FLPPFPTRRSSDHFHVLGLLPHRHCERGQTHRTTTELVHERIQDGPVHPIQAKSVDLVQLQCHTGGLQRQHPVPTHFGVVTYTAQEPIGDPGRTTRPARDLPSGLLLQRSAEHTSEL